MAAGPTRPRGAVGGLLAVSLLLTSGAAAQAPPRIEMTLAEALGRAESSPDVIIARSAQAAAESAIAVVRVPRPPTFTASTHSVTARLGLSLAVPLRWGGQRGTAVDVARAERDAAVADSSAAVDRAREAVTVAWLRLEADEELELLARARVDRLERTASAVRDLFDAGRVPRVDVVRAAAEAASARADVFTASAERRAASAALAFLIGFPPQTEIRASGERPAPAPLPELPALLAKASSSAELRAADARGRAAAGRVQRAKREGLPALTLEGGADIDDPTQEGTDKHLSLGLTIPVGSRAAVLVSSAEAERAAADRARLVRSVEVEVVTTWNRAEASRQRLEVLDGSTIPAAREAAELSRIAYQEGRLDLLRLLESERTLADIRANRIETWVLWGSQRASLERLVGGVL